MSAFSTKGDIRQTRNSEQLLILDEVGKTIETGIILTELLARVRITRRNPVS
jgi:hypothetical protein